ncbi:MAG: hypothetical protein V3V99_03160 [candidate division Zixibacteria bacterium]
MLLSMQALIETEQKLRAIIDHAQQELEAVQLLIKGHELRSEEADSGSKKQTLHQSMLYQIERFQGKWFTGRQITDRLISAGIRKETERARVQSILANYLKKLSDKGKLERKNVKPESQRGRFEYRQITKED